MIKEIYIKNPNIFDNEITRLTKRYTGGTELDVENGEGFTNNDFIVVGKPTYEKTEQGQVGSSASLAITLLAALNFPHDQDTPVYYTKFNQYSLEYQTSSGGAWTAFSGMPTNIEWDDIYSQFITPDGNYYAVRWRFYNSTTGEYSSYSPTLPIAGWTRNQAGTMIDNVRRLIKDKKGELATDDEILALLDDGQQHLLAGGVRKKWWFLKVDPASWTATQASVSKYDLPSDYMYMDHVMYHYTSGDIEQKYRLLRKSEAFFDALQSDLTQDPNDEVSYWTERPPDSDNEVGYIELYSTPETANQGFKPIYYKKFTTIDSASDKTECPRPDALEFHAAMIILETNDRSDTAGVMEKRRNAAILELEIQNKRYLDHGEFLQFRGQRGWSNIHGKGTRISRDALHTDYFTDEYR